MGGWYIDSLINSDLLVKFIYLFIYFILFFFW